MFVCELNGRPATAQDLAPLAFAGYAHYTSMQVRTYSVVGLDRHLDRLTTSAVQLFGAAPERDRLRDHLRGAVRQGDGDASADVTLTSRDRAGLLAGDVVEPDVLVRTGPPVRWGSDPLRIRSTRFERFLARFKHADTMAAVWHVRRAAGFDDVVYVTPAGELSEGSIWNVAFLDIDEVVWPSASALPGITQGLVQDGLTRLGVPWRTDAVHLDRLDRYRGAVLMNSWTPAAVVGRINAVELADSAVLARLTAAAYAQHEAEEV